MCSFSARKLIAFPYYYTLCIVCLVSSGCGPCGASPRRVQKSDKALFEAMVLLKALGEGSAQCDADLLRCFAGVYVCAYMHV